MFLSISNPSGNIFAIHPRKDYYTPFRSEARFARNKTAFPIRVWYTAHVLYAFYLHGIRATESINGSEYNNGGKAGPDIHQLQK